MTKKKAPVRAKRKASPPAEERVLVLRTCAADMSAHGGFVWPELGPVSCPDWDPAPRCGGGLHGALWGEGCGELLSWAEDAKWLVVEVRKSEVVELDGKVKFPRGKVLYCGARQGAIDLIQRPGRAVIGASITAGDSGTATAGDSGTATAGTRGTATAGYGGTATAGYGGTATAGDSGILSMRWYDAKANRCRIAIGYVGEDNIKANTAYTVDDAGKLQKVVK